MDLDNELYEAQTKIFEMKNRENVNKLSNGYHTFDLLYKQRLLMFMVICNTYGNASWKSRRHHPEDRLMPTGIFVAGITMPNGTYTVHCKMDIWDRFNVKELSNAPKKNIGDHEDFRILEDLIK